MKEIQKKIKREFDVICYTRDHFEMMHTQKLVVERMYKKYTHTHTHTHTHNTTQHNTTQHNTTQHKVIIWVHPTVWTLVLEKEKNR